MISLRFILKFFGLVRESEKVEEVVEEPTPPIPPFVIEKLVLAPNPRYQGKLWGYRPPSYINKLIVHQSLSEADTIAIHEYHISKKSHIKPGTGAPKICYHYTIEKSGKVYLVNDPTDVVWHCKGQNMESIGILVLGDFDGVEHVGKSKPTEEQLASLRQLLDKLVGDYSLPRTEVYGHSDFGKPACPGFVLDKFIEGYRNEQ